MTIVFRIFLILASLITFAGIVKKIRAAKVQIESALFWIVFAFILLLFSIFPWIATIAARAIGIYSTVNFVFLFVIFILLIRQFFSDIKTSQLESKLNELVQELAIKELEEND